MSSGQEVHIVAVFYPRAEKAARVKELLSTQCAIVQDKEDYALRFILTEKIDGDIPEFCLFETYQSEKAVERHLAESHFKDMTKKMKDEDLLAANPYVARTVSIAGFDLGRQAVVSSS